MSFLMSKLTDSEMDQTIEKAKQWIQMNRLHELLTWLKATNKMYTCKSWTITNILARILQLFLRYKIPKHWPDGSGRRWRRWSRSRGTRRCGTARSRAPRPPPPAGTPRGGEAGSGASSSGLSGEGEEEELNIYDRYWLQLQGRWEFTLRPSNE